MEILIDNNAASNHFNVMYIGNHNDTIYLKIITGSENG